MIHQISGGEIILVLKWAILVFIIEMCDGYLVQCSGDDDDAGGHIYILVFDFVYNVYAYFIFRYVFFL